MFLVTFQNIICIVFMECQPFVTDKEFCGIRILHVHYHSEVQKLTNKLEVYIITYSVNSKMY